MHAGFAGKLDVRESAARLESTIDGLRDMMGRLGVEVWSYRVALPPGLGVDRGLRLCEGLCRDGVLVAAYHSDIGDSRTQDVVDVLGACERSYVALRLSRWSEVDDVVRMYSSLAKSVDVDDFTRVGISIPDYVETPYFPLATAFNDGFSIALRYVDLVKGYLAGIRDRLVGFVKAVGSLAAEVESSVGMRFLGVDYSISPWASESVVELVEGLSDVRFALPGSGWALGKLNEVIVEVIRSVGVRGLGFNEVMLPVAEDDLLKIRVAEGLVTLRDLTYLTAYCLVGVDMVVVRDDQSIIRGVVRDVFRSASIKGRTVGVRLIPVGMPEGSEVILKRFGRTPVIRY